MSKANLKEAPMTPSEIEQELPSGDRISDQVCILEADHEGWHENKVKVWAPAHWKKPTRPPSKRSRK